MRFSVAALLALAARASAHGLITTPEARTPGAATEAVCGKGMVDFYKQDPTSYPEALLRGKGWESGYDAKECNLWLCRGYQFEDNMKNVKTYKAGDVIDIKVAIRIPHLGYANVSVVDTSTNKVIGEPMLVWKDGYADGKLFPNLPKDQLEFSVKIPDLKGQCTQSGVCVVQWYWFGQGQTYESCIDFTVPAAA